MCRFPERISSYCAHDNKNKQLRLTVHSDRLTDNTLPLETNQPPAADQFRQSEAGLILNTPSGMTQPAFRSTWRLKYKSFQSAPG